MYRYHPAIRKYFEMIKAGQLGEIYQIDAEMSTYHSKELREWLSKFKGGSMYIFGSHLVDLIVGLLGEPKRVISAIKQTGYDGIYSDDNCFAMLEYDKAVAKITNLSLEVNGWAMRRFAVMGSKGTVEIKPLEFPARMRSCFIENIDNHYCCDGSKAEDIDDIDGDCRYDEMIKDFYYYVVGEKANPFSYSHDYLVQKVLTEIIK